MNGSRNVEMSVRRCLVLGLAVALFGLTGCQKGASKILDEGRPQTGTETGDVGTTATEALTGETSGSLPTDGVGGPTAQQRPEPKTQPPVQRPEPRPASELAAQGALKELAKATGTRSALGAGTPPRKSGSGSVGIVTKIAQGLSSEE